LVKDGILFLLSESRFEAERYRKLKRKRMSVNQDQAGVGYYTVVNGI